MHKVRLTQNNYQLVAENSGQSPEVLMSNYNEAREIEKRALAAMVERSFYPEIAVSTPQAASAEPKSRPCRSDFEESASSNGLCATEHHSHRLAKFSRRISRLSRTCC